ncbi:MAG TPA: hypothetical protein VMV07_11325 [Streptosporangiaceae bacterium]|nr:hypothetical protein [Streptosporangiaceae bacterium]
MHQGQAEPPAALAYFAGRARRIASTAPSGSLTGKAARRLLRIFTTAGQTPDSARRAIAAITDPQIRATAGRLMDMLD